MKYRDYLILPAIIMYIIFASCAFVAKANPNSILTETDIPVASVNPKDISWGTSLDTNSIGEFWYAEGTRAGECFAVENAVDGSNDIYFFNKDSSSVLAVEPTPFVIKDMHMHCATDTGRNYDIIFLDEMTAYDCISETYYQRADAQSLFDQMISGKFVNTTNNRDYYVFNENGKSSEYFGDQVFRGKWNLDTSETVAVYDNSCKEYFYFNLIFDTYGNVSGFTFNEIVYTLVN